MRESSRVSSSRCRMARCPHGQGSVSQRVQLVPACNTHCPRSPSFSSSLVPRPSPSSTSPASQSACAAPSLLTPSPRRQPASSPSSLRRIHRRHEPCFQRLCPRVHPRPPRPFLPRSGAPRPSLPRESSRRPPDTDDPVHRCPRAAPALSSSTKMQCRRTPSPMTALPTRPSSPCSFTTDFCAARRLKRLNAQQQQAPGLNSSASTMTVII